MRPHFMLTPYYLDEEEPGLQELAGTDWVLNQPPLPRASTQTRLSVLHTGIAREVVRAVEDQKLPISLAGDCCSTIGVLAGLQRQGLNPLLVWFDAHGDFNTWDTSPSGFLGGMPLAMLVGLGEQTMLEINQVKPLDERRVILSDARDLDPQEEELVKDSRIVHLRDPRALLDYPLEKEALWVHFDCDVVNPVHSPAQHFPAPGGPSPDVLKDIFEMIGEKGHIQAVSMSSWAPDLPGSDQSQQVSLDLLRTLYKNKER